jgi:hypothetical protein
LSFLLEILTGNSPVKPEAFWHTPKKHSQASQAEQACTTAPPPVPAHSAPAIVPAMSLEPHALATSMVAPSPPLPRPLAMLDDVVIEALSSLLLTTSPIPSKCVPNQAFGWKFPHCAPDAFGAEANAQTKAMKVWLPEAYQQGFTLGQVCNAVQYAGHGEYLFTELFSSFLDRYFTNAPLTSASDKQH